MESVLDFEKPISTLEKKLSDLKDLAQKESLDLKNEIHALESKLSELIEKTYQNLTTWQRVQVARHPNRPHAMDYIERLFPEFLDIHGDRCFGDDDALIAGFAEWKDPQNQKPLFPVAILAQEKGRSTKMKMKHNFGMVRPEGYRKAIRVMKLADRLKIPVLSFIDTPGAYPGIDAEERGQATAIAESILTMTELKCPTLAVVIGEGGSGGALAIGVANEVLLLEHSIYSVISPESCASILWNNSQFAEQASMALKMDSQSLMKLNVIDGIIPEPKGGAHRNWDECLLNVQNAIHESWKKLKKISDLKEHRQNKFRKIDSLGYQNLGVKK